MKTLPGVLGATSKDACLAPPGYGWNASSQEAAICPKGSYSPGWGREPCQVCDAANGTITTEVTGAAAADDCYTPAGHGARKTADGAYTGYACPADTYGRGNHTFGLVEVSWCAVLHQLCTQPAPWWLRRQGCPVARLLPCERPHRQCVHGLSVTSLQPCSQGLSSHTPSPSPCAPLSPTVTSAWTTRPRATPPPLCPVPPASPTPATDVRACPRSTLTAAWCKPQSACAHILAPATAQPL